MCIGPEETFFQRRHGHQTHEKIFNIINHQGNVNQNYSKISPHTSQNVQLQEDHRRPVLMRMYRKRDTCTLLVRT